MDTVVEVNVPGVFALKIDQQPRGRPTYITDEPGRATQYHLARKYGALGILAHNDLAGKQFRRMRKNQPVVVVYASGRQETYAIREIQRYQALSPTSPFSDFINLDCPDELLTAGQLFKRVYGPGGRLVLQTCIEAFGEGFWGRLFVIAVPVTSSPQDEPAGEPATGSAVFEQAAGLVMRWLHPRRDPAPVTN